MSARSITPRTPSRPALRGLALLLSLASASAGCSVLDLPNPPTFELNDNDRACRVDDDCSGVEIVSERGSLLASSDPDGEAGPLPPCLNARVICNTAHNVCEAEVRVRDADDDGTYDPNCRGYDFAPLEEDCDDSDPEVGMRDADGDGQVSVDCMRDPGSDCDDTRATVRSGASVEICDGFVSDCDAWVDGVSAARPAEDADGDQVAAPDAPCEAPPAGSRELTGGFAKTDCDDDNPYIFPGAPEVCDGFINDCGLGSGPRPGEDDDGDGFAPPGANCEETEDFPKTDCADDNPATYPGAPEICDGLTNDCDAPQVPRLEEDADGDGFASFDAPCAPGPIPYGECVNGGDSDPTSRYCKFLERIPSLDTLDGAAALTFLDYDDDGLGDIVAGSSSGGGALNLYTQIGPGEFMIAPDFTLNAGVSALRSGPLFGDDRDDLVVVRSSAGEIEVACNVRTAAGAPAAAVVVAGVTGLSDAAIVRMRNNASAVVAISPLQGTLHVATRQFAVDPMNRCVVPSDFAVTPIPLGSVTPTAVAAGRLVDPDGTVDDVVVATDGGQVLLLTNNPVAFGGLSLRATPIATGVNNAQSATVGDFDGDGAPDIAIGTATGVHYLRNAPSATNGFELSTIPGAPTSVDSVHARDINFDGRDDLVTASSAEDTVHWWELVGSTWVPHLLVSDFNGASAAVTGDVDGDGDLDVIGTARDADVVTWWTTEISSNVGFLRSRVDRAFDGAVAVVAAEMNGDGRPDIVGLGGGLVGEARLLSWWRVDGSAAAPVYTETVISPSSTGSALVAGDLDANGTTDVVAAETSGGLRAFLNAGDGVTWTRVEMPNGLGMTGAGVVALALGDVTGDGLPDIVGVTPDDVAYWANSGGATPSFARTTVGSISSGSGVALGDTDGDGLMDIVVSGASGLRVFSRASQDSAFVGTDINGAPPAEHVVVGDIDGDGRAEIFSGARLLSSLVAYWSWNGNGNQGGDGYDIHVLSTSFASTWTHRLALVDVDLDGDQDLLFASGATGLHWFENLNGTATGWLQHPLSAVGAVGESLAAADFDADGDTDVAVAHGADSEVVLYKNDGVAWWRPSGR